MLVLDCDPHLNDIKELLTELNKSNGLFKFVRTMREKFQEAALYGMPLYLTYLSFPPCFKILIAYVSSSFNYGKIGNY